MVRFKTFKQFQISHMMTMLIIAFLSVGARADFVTTAEWQITSGLTLPESVVYDAKRDRFYVSSMGTNEGGYISIITADGQMETERWVEEGLSTPLGLALMEDTLYVADGQLLFQITIDADGNGTLTGEFATTGASLNDVTIKAQGNVYTSDFSVKNSIYHLLDDQIDSWTASKANGLLAETSRLVVVDTDAGELQAINYDDQTVTTLATVVTGGLLDGLTSDGQNGYYVTDYNLGQLFHVTEDGTSTEMLVGELATGVADLTYVPTKKLLVIPNMEENTLTAFKEETFKLTVALNDTTTTPELAGSVMSEPMGIQCGETCEAEFAKDGAVQLTAVPDSITAIFTGWTGDCDGTDNPITVTMDADKTCTPTFEAQTATPDTPLTLNIMGTGTGEVTSKPQGGACDPVANNCANYPSGTQVMLIAVSGAGSHFTQWGGDCGESTESMLNIVMDAAKTCEAHFELDANTETVALTVEKPDGGMVKDLTGPIDCGDTCTADYTKDSTVELKAIASAGFQFKEWSNCATSTDNPLTVTADTDKTCGATFEPASTNVFALTVTPSPTNGKITTQDGHIDCGTTCTKDYDAGTSVSLNAIPDSGFSLAGWTGDCTGTEPTLALTLDSAKTCSATFQATSVGATLTVQKQGTGAGTVTSNVGDINCGATCQASFNATTEVTLTATPEANAIFAGWGSDCSTGTETTVTLTVDAVKTCLATFNVSAPQPVTLSIQKVGAGTVISDSGGINCGDTCQADYSSDTTVKLTAIPDAGFTHLSWSDNCPEGQVLMDSAKTCTATFGTLAQSQLVMTITGDGQGTVSADRGAIQNCGAENGVCRGDYAMNDTIMLTAIATEGSSFGGWSGRCFGSTETASVNIQEETVSCGAKFLSDTPTLPSTQTKICVDGNIVQGTCNVKGQTIANANITKRGNISNVLLSGNITNAGWISNATVQEGAVVTGGVMTGFITNNGRIADIQFRGASIIGGQLSGNIWNIRNGLIKDVTLAPGAYVKGGKLAGRIQGDCDNPAVVDNVTVDATSHLSCVTLGENVVTMQGAIIDPIDGTPIDPWPTLPALGLGLATNVTGETLTEVQANFAGGISLDTETFVQTTEIQATTDIVDIRGTIQVDATHIESRADIFVFVTYSVSPESEPVHLMLDKDRNILPWDENMANLVAFQEDVELTTEQRLEMYQGVLLNTGVIVVNYGYRLENGTVVYSADSINLTVNEANDG